MLEGKNRNPLKSHYFRAFCDYFKFSYCKNKSNIVCFFNKFRGCCWRNQFFKFEKNQIPFLPLDIQKQIVEEMEKIEKGTYTQDKLKEIPKMKQEILDKYLR